MIGDIPDDLNGVYLRNTENPLFEPIKRYHPFDGDGMLHAISFENGEARYANRFVRTDGVPRRAGGPTQRCGPASPSTRRTRSPTTAGALAP